MITFAATAEADPSGQTVVAVAALAVALLTTLATLGVQLWTHRSTHRQTRQKDRYQELLKAYSDAGEVMAAATQSLVTAVAAAASGRRPRPDVALAPFEEATARYRHLKNMLVLHGAPSAVLDAVAAWRTLLEAYVRIPEVDVQAREAAQGDLEDALVAFYSTAGEDARRRAGLRA